ncbi:MAG: DUF5309 family protein [Deltaproteobacteria bacterium]|nr:DUF5309 family protein [Deltaproteobacteria bacterium]
MATILGLRDTANLTSDERPKNWRETILRLYPRSNQKAPLNALIAAMRREPTNDPEFNWFEKGLPIRHCQVNYSTGYDSTATSLTIDGPGATVFRADDLLKNDSTGEVMRVTANQSSATAITVARGYGTTAATGISDNDYLFVCGTAIAEGAGVRSSLYTDPTKRYNYTAIFRHPLNLTNTARATRQRTGAAYQQMKLEALDQHTVDMERAFIFGERKEDLTGSEPKRATGGIISFLTTNVTEVSGGNLTAAAWEDFLRGLFAYGSDEKLCFCGNKFLMVINQIARNIYTVNLQADTSVAGIKVVKWITPFGTVYFKNHPLFNELVPHTKIGLFIEPKHIIYRPLKGNGVNRDTKLLKNRQTAGEDKTTDEYLTEAGLEIQHEKVHGLLTNVNAYSAS